MNKLTLGVVTDPHLGPDTRFRGALRKVGSATLSLLEEFVTAMNRLEPDLVLLLGDGVEDVSKAVDIEHYREVFEVLSALRAPLFPVAGNHDLLNMSAADVLARWATLPHMASVDGLSYTFRVGGADFVVLHSHEVRDSHIFIDAPQLAWLEATLTALAGPVFVLVHHSLAEMDTRANLWFADHPHIALIRGRGEIRALLEGSGKVVAVLNGHVHSNHVAVHGGIPYVTIQSLVENIESLEPAEPCGAWATVVIEPPTMDVTVVGTDPAHYRLSLGRLAEP